MADQRDIDAILRDAFETLQTAEWGLADVLGADPRRRMPGLRNLIVFGRAVTNVVQNIRSAVGGDHFDAWYSPLQDEMRQDELLRYFYQRRSEILKEGSVGQVTTSMHISQLNTSELQPLMQNPPPGAKGFFIGDQLGGSGWEVELPDGSITKYYVALPEDLSRRITTRLHFSDPPSTHKGRSLADTSIEALAQHYVAYLRTLLEAAQQHFAA